MSASTSTARVSNHNNWPVVELFPCEREFLERMGRHNIQQIFVTATLVPNDADEPFNAAVGHVLDCLDSLPKRPDAAFDSLYKVIDQNLNAFSQPNTSRMCSLVDAFFRAAPREWAGITEILASNLPQQTADYAASRALDCYIVSNPPHTEEIKKRATRSLGPQRYREFCDKFLVANPQNPSVLNLPYNNRRNAGRLMRLLFRQTTAIIRNTGKPSASATPSLLDLTVHANILPPKQKLHSLLEICLSTYRHERFHGEAFSPFRSSKAKLKTYAHAYYMLMVSYVVVLGMFHHLGRGGISISDVSAVAQDSMQRFSTFFGQVLDE